MRVNGGALGRKIDPTPTEASGVWKFSEYMEKVLYGTFPKYTTGYDLTYVMNNQSEWNGVFSSTAGVYGSHFLSLDGTKFYEVEHTANTTVTLREFNLTTPNNISTLSQVTSINIASVVMAQNIYGQIFVNVGNPEFLPCISFTPDGTQMYVSTYINNNSGSFRIFRWNLGTPWSISTAVHVGDTTKYYTDLIGYSNLVGAYRVEGIFWQPDGSSVFISYPSYVAKFTAATPFDITTTTWDFANSYQTSTETGPVATANGLGLVSTFFKSDGTEMYVAANTGYDNGRVIKYSLPQPWNPSSSVPVDEIAVGEQDNPETISFKDDGTKLFVFSRSVGSEYTLKTPWTLNAAPTYYGNTSVQPTLGFEFRPDGRKLYIINADTVETSRYAYEYNLSTPFDIRTASFFQTSNLTILTASGISSFYAQDITFSPDGTKAFGVFHGSSKNDFTNSGIFEFSLPTPWNILNMNRTQVAYPGAANNITGIQLSIDGTKAYTLCANNDRVFQYNLSTPWNVSTLTYSGKNKSIAAQTQIPMDLKFNQNGTKMFLLGYDSYNGTELYRIFEYSLSVAWDITTANYSFKRYNLPIATYADFSVNSPAVYSFDISPDGTKLFYFDSNNGKMHQFTLG